MYFIGEGDSVTVFGWMRQVKRPNGFTRNRTLFLNIQINLGMGGGKDQDYRGKKVKLHPTRKTGLPKRGIREEGA